MIPLTLIEQSCNRLCSYGISRRSMTEFDRMRNSRASQIPSVARFGSSRHHVRMGHRYAKATEHCKTCRTRRKARSSTFSSNKPAGRLSTIGSLQLNLSGRLLRSSVGVLDTIRAISNSPTTQRLITPRNP
jgi:hypothetical protein